MFYTARPKRKWLRSFIGVYGALAVVGGIFFFGFYIGRQTGAGARSNYFSTGEGSVLNREAPAPYLLQDVDFGLFWDVWRIVKEKSLGQPVLDTQMLYGAISGMVGSLGDPYSVFFDPETTRKFTEELAGKFDGIGAEIGIKHEQLVIIAPLPDSPAQRAGIQPGDKVLKIDDKDTVSMPLDVAVSNIRGAKGTVVVLKILRNGAKEPRDFSITRDTINVKSVTSKDLPGAIGYIKLVYFNETTNQLFEEALQGIIAKNPKGIILDLRNNPGGFLEVGVDVASQWIPDSQVVVTQQSQDGTRQEFRAAGQARFHGIPTVVLVNGGSASASEIVAGALQDYKAAQLIGEKTFGKGSVQTFEPLRGGSSIKITVAHWLTPKGRQINGIGITPDIEVKMGKDDYENDKDPQLQKAVEILSGILH